MKRWIIRSFFIGLLLLCVSGWVGSYPFSVYYTAKRCWGVGWGRTGIAASCNDTRIVDSPQGWSIAPPRMGSLFGWWVGESEHQTYDLCGFEVCASQYSYSLIIPFWFPTTISTALLWWVWRKTRLPVKGRAFPVEVAKR